MNYTDERIALTANVRRATLRDGLRRLQAREEAVKGEFSDPAEWFMRCYTYVDAISATPTGALTVDGEVQPWPPTYEQFVDLLPVTSVDEWYEEVYQLNPGWRPVIPEPEPAQEKKD